MYSTWNTCEVGALPTSESIRIGIHSCLKTFHSTWNRLLIALVLARSTVGGFAAILEVFSRWRKTVGSVLAGEDPKILVRIVELASAKGGISQSDLQKDLKINQPRLSKMTKRLVSARWVVVRKSSSDRRVLLMRATDHAKTRVERLRTELSVIGETTTPPAPKRSRRLGLPSNQGSLLPSPPGPE